MSDDIKYVPMLKAKRGEFRAISELGDSKVSCIMPLFDFPKNTEETLQETSRKILSNVRRYWPNRSSMYFDFYDIDYSAISAEGFLCSNFFEELQRLGVIVIPVVWHDREDRYKAEIASLQCSSICFRIDKADLLDTDDLNLKIDDLADFMNVEYGQVDLLLDLRIINEADSSEMVCSVLNNIRSIDEFRRVVLASTAWPESLGGFESNSIHLIPRYDYDLWLNVSRNSTSIPRVPVFGDYGIVPANFVDIDFRTANIGAKIRYSLPENWVLVKGTGTRGNPRRVQMPQLSRMLVKSRHYSLADQSSGSKYISDCATGMVGPGNSETWVWVDVNQHIYCVLNQLSSLS